MADEEDGDHTAESEPKAAPLPPIHHIKLPETKVLSTRIRWLHALGYEVKEIHQLLGCRYQQVRNVVMTKPKRAAREDMPPLVIELLEIDDDLEAMDKHFMEREMMAQRGEARKAQRATNKARRVVEEDLDDENYGRG